MTVDLRAGKKTITMPGLLLVFLAILVIYVVSYYRWVSKYPKGPLPLPFIGNMLQIPIENTHVYLESLSKTYGNAFTVFLPRPHVVFTDYEHIKEAFVTQGDTFIGRTHLPPETLLQRNDQAGILISDGEVWREQRRTSLQILRNFGMGKNLMEQQVKRCIEEMLLQFDEAQDKSKVDVFLPVQLCVGNVINETLFGYHFSHKSPAKFEHFVAVVTEHLRLIKDSRSLLFIQAFPWMKHLPFIGYEGFTRIHNNVSTYQDFIEAEVKAQIETFDENSEPQNFVHAYLREAKRRNEPLLNVDQLCAVVIDFWMAGMETTSTSSRWALLYFQKYPEVQEKVQEEIDRVVGRERLPSMADKPSMPYTQAVIHEIQRCSNMIPFLGIHRCTEDTSVLGKPIPRDSFVFAQIHAVLAEDPAFENPKEFRPERFLSEDGKTINRQITDRLIAFGMGKRVCAGEGLARMELFLILTALLQRYTFSSKSLDMEPVYGSVLLPKRQFCTISPRA